MKKNKGKRTTIGMLLIIAYFIFATYMVYRVVAVSTDVFSSILSNYTY